MNHASSSPPLYINDSTAKPVCISSSCISLAASVLSGLDESQDPCENFYDFASKPLLHPGLILSQRISKMAGG